MYEYIHLHNHPHVHPRIFIHGQWEVMIILSGRDQCSCCQPSAIASPRHLTNKLLPKKHSTFLSGYRYPHQYGFMDTPSDIVLYMYTPHKIRIISWPYLGATWSPLGTPLSPSKNFKTNAYFLGASPKEKCLVKCNHLSHSQFKLDVQIQESAPASQINSYIFWKLYVVIKSYFFWIVQKKNKDCGHQSAVKNDKLLQSEVEQLRRMRKSQDAKNYLSIHYNITSDRILLQQARKLQATLVRNSAQRLSDSLTGVKCRATSIAKNVT